MILQGPCWFWVGVSLRMLTLAKRVIFATLAIASAVNLPLLGPLEFQE